MKKKRVNRKSTVSPSPMASPPIQSQSPKSNTINKTTSSSKRNYKYRKPTTTIFSSPSLSPPPPLMNNSNKTLGNISDLKEMAVSRLDDLKRSLIDRSHSEILRDIEASHSRLHKRCKIQMQTCQQMMEEAEKEYRKMSEQINESQEAMKASYAEFVADAQATASGVCKRSIPELSRSFEKTIADLQRSFGTTGT